MFLLGTLCRADKAFSFLVEKATVACPEQPCVGSEPTLLGRRGSQDPGTIRPGVLFLKLSRDPNQQ